MAGPTVDYQSLHDPGTSSRTGSPLSSAAQQPHSTVTSSTKLLQPNENGRKGPRDSHKHDRSDAQTVESIGSEADDSEREGDEQTFLSAEDSPALSELKRRIARRRVVTLACACLLSVGSHYSHYTLGPIKKSLKTSEGHFAALLSALELASTITPLLAGLWVPRFGAAAVGLAATGAIFVGQLIVCFAFSREGGVDQTLGGMITGLLIFGTGVSPLAVAQETIVLQHTSSKFVARSVSLALVLGKTASFAAGWSSEPLHAISPRAPFVVAAGLSALSFTACIIYALLQRSTDRLVASVDALQMDGAAGASGKPSNEKTSQRRTLKLSALASFGDSFWLYIAVCAFAGSWNATNHNASHFLQAVYDLPQSKTSKQASVLLALSTFLYPIIGWALDKRPYLLHRLWLLVPTLCATTFVSLLFFSSFLPPVLALLPAAVGMGSGPLLLVLVVPRMLPKHQTATALGAHKSVEMAGAIILQSAVGVFLSLGAGSSSSSGEEGGEEGEKDNATYAIAFLLIVALAMLAVVVRWWSGMRASEGRREVRLEGGEGGSSGAEDEQALLPADGSDVEASPRRGVGSEAPVDGKVGLEEGGLRRGRVAMRAATVFVAFSWVCFVVNLFR